MASPYTVKRATHPTLSAATADIVNFTEAGHTLCVMNRDATQVIYFRIDGTAAVVAADENYVVPAGVGKALFVKTLGGVPRISLISTAGGAYSVMSFPADGTAT